MLLYVERLVCHSRSVRGRYEVRANPIAALAAITLANDARASG